MSLTADAADGKTGYRSSADANSISGKGENVCVRTSLICSGGYQSRQPPRSWPCHIINERLIKLRTRLRSLHFTVKVWVRIMHVNFNFRFKLGPKVGRILYKSAYYNQIFTVSEKMQFLCFGISHGGVET